MKKLHFLALTTTFVSCMFISACSTVGKSEPWYLGSFSYATQDATERNLIKLTCISENVCEFQTINPSSKSQGNVTIKTTTSITIDVEPQNGNLSRARETLKKDSSLYQNSDESTILKQLKPVFESTAQFTECKFITDTISFCLIEDKTSKMQTPILAVLTMKGACGSWSPFCSHSFIPLKKRNEH